jgi:flagellar basal-body rod modification protein FlgD
MAIAPGVSSNVTATMTGGNSATLAGAVNSNETLASNFTTFLQLLTTQLKNQNPLDPLDTNQFTQQLVQFAQVEQQLKSNDQLSTLVALQKTAQSTQALGFVGQIVAIDGQTTKLENNQAGWSFSSSKPSAATINIKNAAGVTVYTGAFSLNAGTQNFIWDGRANNGVKQPDGNYTISITAKDPSGQSVAVSTEIQGVVDSVDLSKSPPILSVGGQDYTLDKVNRVVRYVPPPAPPPATS